ncbi:MAG: MmcQ/YjbR family DNA-binding protein [Flavobacteriales bacterium]|nr:MmcQ/YjbR family DNA-binding protein [Flavobacteriales bacterium]
MEATLVRAMALDMPGTAEKDHFGKPAFSVKKKIYCTWWVMEERAVLKLTREQQATLSEEQPDAYRPLPNKWGLHGWTNVDLGTVGERSFRYALDLAWRNVAPKWLIPTRLAPPKG